MKTTYPGDGKQSKSRFSRRLRGGSGATLAFATLAVAAFAAAPKAAPPLVLQAVPQGALAVYVAPGQQAGAPAGDGQLAVQLVATLSDQAHQLGLLSKLPTSIRGWVDVLSSLPEVIPYPHAVALLDVTARPRQDGGHELAALGAAMIVTTRGANSGLEKRIQHLLNVYTNTEQATLSNRSYEGEVAHTIRDHRLPPWATISWGSLGDQYVVALGEGVYERLADTIARRSPSLFDDAWLAQAVVKIDVSDGALLGYADFARLRRQADRALAEKIEDVTQALSLGGAERALVTFFHAQRSVEAAGVLRRSGEDEIVPLVGRRFLAEVGESVIPGDARGYAAIDLNPPVVVRSVAEAYLAARSPGARERVRSFWRDVEGSTGVGIERDILQHLGRPMIIHDHPRHVLNLPLAWTFMIPVEGDSGAVRQALDNLLNEASRQLVGQGSLRLVHDADGVWYVQIGLAGPAVVVTDRWLIISFSPTAVRQNIR